MVTFFCENHQRRIWQRQRKHRQFEVCIIYGIFTALDGLCEEDIYKNWFDNIVTTNPNALNECALVH